MEKGIYVVRIEKRRALNHLQDKLGEGELQRDRMEAAQIDTQT